jgi:hypothetical protein
MHASARLLVIRRTMLQELDNRREDSATVRLLWDDRTQIVWLHVQEDGGSEHVVGVPAGEARDAFLCPSLYVGFEHALAAAGSEALDRA